MLRRLPHQSGSVASLQGRVMGVTLPKITKGRTMGNYFDIERDLVQIRAGTHFMCHGCLVSRPLDDQSKDSRYCFACYEALEEEDKVTGPKDYWTSGGFIKNSTEYPSACWRDESGSP